MIAPATTQDGYDWPTPHPVAPLGWALPAGDHRHLARFHERFDAQMDAALRREPAVDTRADCIGLAPVRSRLVNR